MQQGKYGKLIPSILSRFFKTGSRNKIKINYNKQTKNRYSRVTDVRAVEIKDKSLVTLIAALIKRKRKLNPSPGKKSNCFFFYKKFLLRGGDSVFSFQSHSYEVTNLNKRGGK